MKFFTKIEDKNILYTFILCLIAAVCAFVPFIIMEGGIFSLCDDFNTQMIPFAAALNNSLKAGNGAWEWNIGLGAQRLGGYSYYYTGSPFFYLSMLLPGKYFPYMVGPLYILKYALGGTFAYLYLRKYVKERKWAVAGAMLYAFSGFQSINLEYYIFHDIVVFFPLLLMGVDEVFEQNRKSLFIISVALNCALNYFFFFGEVIFLAIYVLFRYLKPNVSFLKQIWKCMYCGIIGMSLTGIIFIPSAIYTSGNPRVKPDIVKMLTERIDLPTLIKAMLLPAEAMNNNSIIQERNWSSASFYIPLIGLSFAVAYIWKNKKDWLSKLLVFLLVFSVFPVCNSMFYLFTSVYYRWLYMLVILIVAATIQVLDNMQDYPIRITSWAWAGITLVYILIYLIGNYKGIDSLYIFRPKTFALVSMIALMNLFFLIVMLYQRKSIWIKYILSISLMCIITTALAIVLYKKTTHEPNYMAYFNAGVSLETEDPQYRYVTLDNILMYPGKANGTGTFSTTISNSTREFEELFEFTSTNTNMSTTLYEGVTELLGGKYEINRDEPCYERYSINERKACPIGYYYDTYITKEKLLEIPLEKRGYALLKNLVVDSDVAYKIGEVTEYDEALSADYAFDTIESYVDINESRKVMDFQREHSGFSCTTTAQSDKTYFFSVPYDTGWEVYIDGEKGEVMNASGFICTIIPSGEHSLLFKYKPPGIVLGAVVSVIGLLVFIWRKEGIK